MLNCDGCGVCCLAMGYPHFRRDADYAIWKGLPEELKREVDDHLATLTDLGLGKPCIWFDDETKQCRHYEHRPQLCRDFEIGNPHCLRLREQFEVV